MHKQMSNKTQAFTTKSFTKTIALTGALLVSALSGNAFADHHNGEMKGNGHHHGEEISEGHHHGMSKEAKGMKKEGMPMGDHADMREVMGNGRLNKIMADKHMVNINHEPMPEMNWPKMRMNFKTDKSVDLSSLKPGQEVDFTLLVDDDNNYLIKEITVK